LLMITWLKKNWLNSLFGILILLMLFYPPAKVWVLQRLMDTGIFNRSANEDASYEAQPMQFSSANGKLITTSALKGKVVFINIWATWCPPCLAELPSIQKLYDRYKADSNVVFVLADADNKVAASSAFLDKRSINLPVYGINSALDPNLYSGTLPTTIILDREGKLMLNHAGIGRYDTESIYRMIDQQLKP
jgi:thiol-disulfide isomerase/thioredoxin